MPKATINWAEHLKWGWIIVSKRTLLSWSSGKDSAYALYLLKKDPVIELVGLFTTVNKRFKRIAMHGVRIDLLKQQALQIGLPLHIIELPYPCSNKAYEAIMQTFITRIQADKIDAVAFGDLFLKDIRYYRIKQLENTGIGAIFPCWGIDTDILAHRIIDIGIRAKLVCLDAKKLTADFAGRDYDKTLLDELPKPIDPCGENGEFHSFVYDAPFFQKQIKISQGETVHREGFIFTDFLCHNKELAQ